MQQNKCKGELKKHQIQLLIQAEQGEMQPAELSEVPEMIPAESEKFRHIPMSLPGVNAISCLEGI